MKTIRNVALGLIAMVLFAYAFTLGAVHWILLPKAKGKFEQIAVSYQTRASLFDAAIQDDEKFFGDLGNEGALRILGPFTGEDAGAFLNAQLGWDDSASASQLSLPKEVEEPLKKPVKEWIQSNDIPTGALDFSWMKRLLKADHWLPVPPKEPQRISVFTLMAFPVPKFQTLLSWVKLRFLHAKKAGDYQDAALEVRHLAELLFTTEQLVGAMVGVAVLSLERSIHDELLSARPELTQSGWKPWSREQIERLKRYLWASPGLASLVVAERERSRFNAASSIGLCLGLNEAAFQYAVGKAFHLPEAKAAVQWFEAILDQEKRCNLYWPRKVWESQKVFEAARRLPFLALGQGEAGNSLLESGTVFSVFPELEVLSGYELISEGLPNFLKLYESK